MFEKNIDHGIIIEYDNDEMKYRLIIRGHKDGVL